METSTINLIMLFIGIVLTAVLAYWLGWERGKRRVYNSMRDTQEVPGDGKPADFPPPVYPDVYDLDWKLANDEVDFERKAPGRQTWVMDSPRSVIDDRIMKLNMNMNIAHNPKGSYYRKGKAKDESANDLDGIYFYDPTGKEE